MNKSFATLFLVLAMIQNIQSQSFERSLTAGFINTIDIVKPMGADQWLMAGRGEPEMGAYYLDTLFVVVMGQDGQIHLRKNLSLPFSEWHYWHDLLALTDGGILACFESSLCDVGADILTVQRLDHLGNLVWEITGNFSLGAPRPPQKWFLAPDGNLLGAGYDQIWKVSPDNGDIFWKASLEGVSGGMITPIEFALIQGTENFVALGEPDFQVWKKNGSPLAPVYVLENSLELSGYRKSLTPGLNGWYYLYKHFPETRIERINENLQHQTLFPTTGFFGSLNLADSKFGLYVAEELPYSARLRRFDSQGQHAITLPNHIILSPVCLAINNNHLAITGTQLSGDLPLNSTNPRSKAAWAGIIPESAPIFNSTLPNIGISEIEQLTEIDTSRFPAIPTGFNYNLVGGNFRLKINNLGSLTVHQASVNTSFGPNEFFTVCNNSPAQQKVYSNLNLAPGESVWVDFGDVKAFGQAKIPDQICFWTSSPNEHPDAMPEDDRACFTAFYTVAVKSPELKSVMLSPNPADEFLEIAFSETLEEEKWQIWDVAGQLVASGVCPEGQGFRLNTSNLKDGVYWLRVKNYIGKLMVHH
ncbi:MAG: T9SS type A sorting domain-containing protein [Saprospiraceae bacterium]